MINEIIIEIPQFNENDFTSLSIVFPLSVKP